MWYGLCYRFKLKCPESCFQYTHVESVTMQEIYSLNYLTFMNGERGGSS